MTKSFQTGGPLKDSALAILGTAVAPTLKGRAYVKWRRNLVDVDDMATIEIFSAGYEAGATAEHETAFRLCDAKIARADAATDEEMRNRVPSEYLGLADMAIETAPHGPDCRQGNVNLTVRATKVHSIYGCTCWKAKYAEARREMRA